VAAQCLQTVLFTGEARILVLVDPANVRRTFQCAVEVIRPGVIGATDQALNFTGLMHQLHSTMAAHVVEYLQRTVAISHHQKGQAHELDRLDVVVRPDVTRKTDACPALCKHAVALELEIAVVGIKLVAKANGFFNRIEYVLEFENFEVADFGRCVHCESPVCLGGISQLACVWVSAIEADYEIHASAQQTILWALINQEKS